MYFLMNSVIESVYTSIHIIVCMIKTILKHRFPLVRPMLNSPYHGCFLFKFLLIGGKEPNAGVI
jgi:hypothetical protein